MERADAAWLTDNTVSPHVFVIRISPDRMEHVKLVSQLSRLVDFFQRRDVMNQIDWRIPVGE